MGEGGGVGVWVVEGVSAARVSRRRQRQRNVLYVLHRNVLFLFEFPRDLPVLAAGNWRELAPARYE